MEGKGAPFDRSAGDVTCEVPVEDPGVCDCDDRDDVAEVEDGFRIMFRVVDVEFEYDFCEEEYDELVKVNEKNRCPSKDQILIIIRQVDWTLRRGLFCFVRR